MAAKPKGRVDKITSGVINAFGRAGPYGVLGSIGIVVQSVLLVWFARAADSIERIWAGGFTVVVLLALIAVVLLIERGRQRGSVAEAVLAAASLDSPGVPREEIERRPKAATDEQHGQDLPPGEIIAAPDGTYVLERPSNRWSITKGTLASMLKEKLGVQDLTGIALPPLLDQATLTLQFGIDVIYTPQPNRTRVNDRPIPMLLAERARRMLQITTVPWRTPPFFTKSSLFDNFINVIGANVQKQLGSIAAMSTGVLPKTNREMLVAEQVQELRHVVVDNKEVARLVITVRFTAVRGDLFDYFFVASNFRMGQDTDAEANAMDREVSALFDSFRIVSAYDLEAEEMADVQRADRDYRSFLAEHANAILGPQLVVAGLRLRQIRLDAPEGIAQAMAILRPFRVFAGKLEHPPGELAPLWAAMEAAEHGDSLPLRQAVTASLAAVPTPPEAALPASSA